MKQENFLRTESRLVICLMSIALMLFSCDRNSKQIISEEFYENGKIKYEEYYYEEDSSVVFAESYYENGQLERVGCVDTVGYQTGLVKSYYSNGMLRDSCEYYKGYCIRSAFRDFPNRNKCYICLMNAAEDNIMSLSDTIVLPKNDTIYFSTFIDGLPVDSYQMYTKTESDSVYSYVYGNHRNDYPYVLFTPNHRDRMILYFMFPNDSNKIIVGKTKQLKFNFIVE